MSKFSFRQPDSEALRRLLSRHPNDATGVVLRLAWREGLTRDEICSLQWDRIDYDARLLRLPERTVPLEDETAACLRAWQARCGEFGPYVAVSEKLRGRLAPQSVSRLARFALDEAGLEGVRLEDLRLDFVRRQLEEHDWPYALRVSGLSVTTYRNTLAQLTRGAPPKESAPDAHDAEGQDFLLWQVLQAEKGTPAGLALWLSTQMGLHMHEIVALTWEQVDFEENVLRLPDRTVPLTLAASQLLRAEQRSRSPGDDPHVLLTPRSRKPMTVARLSTLVRTALIRGGIEDTSLRDLRKDTAQEDARRRIERYAREHGSVSRSEAAELLGGVSGGTAYARLSELVLDGVLVRVNARYFPAGSVIAPEKQAEAIRAYLAEWGASYCKDIADMLHIGKRTTARILRRMVDRGEIVLLRREKRYTLPKHTA